MPYKKVYDGVVVYKRPRRNCSGLNFGKNIQPLTFDSVNIKARSSLLLLLSRWLPDGDRIGNEYVARNPTRADQREGSFKINTTSGLWCDFATGDKGGDPISLAAYLFGISQKDALYRVASELGIQP